MNQIALIGRLGQTPTLKSTQGGVSVCSFSIAVARPHKKDTTDWINCVAWRKNAEFLANYAGKGSKIGITGILTSRKYEDREGATVTTYEVVCDSVELLESRSASVNDNSFTATNKQPEREHESLGSLDGVELLTDDEDLPY